MAQKNVKTNFGRRLRAFLGMHTKPEIDLKNTLQPVIDYHKIIFKRRRIEATGIAGNVVTRLSPGVGKMWKIKSLYIYLDTSADVANRYPLLELVDSANAMIVRLGETAVVVADKVAAMQIYSVTYWSTAPLSYGYDVREIIGYSKELEVWETDQIETTITNGVAGDAYTYDIDVEEYDIIKDSDQ